MMLKNSFCKNLLLLLCIFQNTFSESESEIFSQAHTLLKEKKYSKAGKTFAKIEDLYPQSEQLKEAIFLSAHSFMLGNKYLKSIEMAELLKELDPQYKEKQINAILIKSYSALLNKPERENKYINTIMNLSQDDKIKYKQIRKKCIDILAYKSLSDGLVYANKGQYLVALRYYNHVIKKYPKSSFAPEAYFRCAEIFHHLDMEFDKNQIIKILSVSYHDSEWTHNALKLKHHS